MSSSKTRVLVTGGAGSIGSELCRQLAPNSKVFILDIDETRGFEVEQELKEQGYWAEFRVGDVRDIEVVRDVFSDFKPEQVFHAAALKHVSLNEKYPKEAIDTNVIGTYNVLSEVGRWECCEKFIFISTDKVIHSNSIMGASKKIGEIMTSNKGHVSVRFGNVMGSRGSVIPIWQRQIDNGGPVTVTDKKMERYMMTIPQAVELVLEASKMPQDGRVVILDMGDRVNVLELAKSIVGASGKDVDIKEIGMRPGETLTEELMTLEEKEIAIKEDKFFVIK
jgi:FlaA1/EpsC-like NDP-sugar epimerase